MAVAFFIPDQAMLQRKAQQQQQQQLQLQRLRESQWRFLASVVLETLKEYVETGSTNYLRRRSAAGSATGARKWRKPSQ